MRQQLSVGGLYRDYHGFWVHTAADGEETLRRKTRVLQPAVFLLDLTMPRVDCWAVARALLLPRRTSRPFYNPHISGSAVMRALRPRNTGETHANLRGDDR
jgi:CheY-like chemotaxis protein